MSDSVLRYTVVVRHPETTEPMALLAGQPVPSWAKGLVHSDDLDIDSPEVDVEAEDEAGDDESPDEAETDVAEDEKAPANGEPPRAGRGSSLSAWTDYAEGLGIEVPEDASRDDVIALVDKHNS